MSTGAPPAAGRVDRAAAVRAALCRLVADRGFHGASMSSVAAEAGVATGTAYVHYESKEDLVHATYLEVKADLGVAATAAVDPDAPPEERFTQLWSGAWEHLRARPERARFLLQVDTSPYFATAHAMAMARTGDPMVAFAAAADMAARLVDLPPEVLYDFAFRPLVRLAATDEEVGPEIRAGVTAASWRAITG